MNILPVTLEGSYVRLEPLSMSHRSTLCQALADGALWLSDVTLIPEPDAIDAWLNEAFTAREQGGELPFAIVWKSTGEVVGTSRYDHIDVRHRKLEIGRTWIGESWQRTAVNSEAKYLLLRHAFEELKCLRIQFVTDVANEKSFHALTRIGARVEGILRNHMIMRGGRRRDSYILSIIDSEWPDVQAVFRHMQKKYQVKSEDFGVIEH